MWVITPLGFFSIVCKPDDVGAGTLTVRARVRSDLEELKKQCLPSLSEIVDGGGTDYRYRSKALRSDIGNALAGMVQSLDYDNFKDEVARKQGKKRAEVYGRVWSTLYDLQRWPCKIAFALGDLRLKKSISHSGLGDRLRDDSLIAAIPLRRSPPRQRTGEVKNPAESTVTSLMQWRYWHPSGDE
jgi:hypothetical protein